MGSTCFFPQISHDQAAENHHTHLVIVGPLEVAFGIIVGSIPGDDGGRLRENKSESVQRQQKRTWGREILREY